MIKIKHLRCGAGRITDFFIRYCTWWIPRMFRWVAIQGQHAQINNGFSLFEGIVLMPNPYCSGPSSAPLLSLETEIKARVQTDQLCPLPLTVRFGAIWSLCKSTWERGNQPRYFMKILDIRTLQRFWGIDKVCWFRVSSNTVSIDISYSPGHRWESIWPIDCT